MDIYNIIVMPGEGIGLETTAEGVKILKTVSECFNIRLDFSAYEVGIEAYKKYGSWLPPDAKDTCDKLYKSQNAAILFGAVEDEPIGILRKDYDLFANLRPIKIFDSLISISPLKEKKIHNINILIVRELVSGIYYGKSKTGVEDNVKWALQEMYYNEDEIRRICKTAMECALLRSKHVTLVHKDNVIKEVFNLWKEVFYIEGRNYPNVTTDDYLVDNMAMQMILNPQKFDVILCSNLMGDILSDLGAGLIGSLGLLPSVSKNMYGFSLYEAIGGTAPDIAGKNIANPIATILSVALMCRYTFKNEKAAVTIEQAVNSVLNKYRTIDIKEENCQVVSTDEMGTLICDEIKRTFHK